MAEQTIQSEDISVASVFQSFYAVPDYQREYVWEAEQVEQLLTDVLTEQADAPPGQAPEYFIGSIVVCPGEGGVLDLIDGQQRMTTLFLILCAVRDHLKAAAASVPAPLPPQIAWISCNELGQEVFRYRLDLQYEDSGDVLERIASDDWDGKTPEPTTRSMANIVIAYSTARDFFSREFEQPQEVKAFYGYLTNKVKLIRIQTEDVAKALKIFETINDRGVGLDSMDLLKNLLFMKADRSSFEKLKTKWKTLQDTIHQAGEKPLRFLRYFIFSRYEVEKLREEEIYGWFSRNAKLCGFDRDPLGFADELIAAARAYENFLNNRDTAGKERPSLESLNTLAGSASRQHMILLLAGRSLPPNLFDRLVEEVETLLFAYTITREHTRTFERQFAQWTNDLRQVQDQTTLEAFVTRTIAVERAKLTERFWEAMARLTFDSLQKYRLRYLLAKLTQDLDIRAYGPTESTRWLRRYMSNEYEIEHIYPQGASADSVAEFGVCNDPNIAQKLGNLTLIEKSINASLSNRPYSEKRAGFGQSNLLLTRAIAEQPKVGSNTKIDVAVAGLEPFSFWNEKSVVKRQQVLTKLAANVWRMGKGVSS